MDKQIPGDDAQDRLMKLAQADPAVMKIMIQRYSTERNPSTKDFLKSVLSTIQKPDLLAVSTQLATSGDAAQRKDGFELMQQLSADSPEVRKAVQKALATEQTPAVLAQALSALKPAAVEQTESDAIVAQLRSLSMHMDPSVRSQSLLQLAQWDKKGEGQERYSQALVDQSPEVRQAAIVAIAQSGLRTDMVKAGLMSVITSGTESKEVKGSALQVLERFSLSKEEMASFNQARSQLR